MSYSDPNQNPIPETTNDTSSIEPVQQFKLYHALIFSVPICFTFIVLFVFYVIYLRRRSSSVDWSSLGMRGGGSFVSTNNLSKAELGLSKELREMLPIVIFKESFSINDSQCSVCLADYQANEKLQQIPPCGHTFHLDCIDLWLTSHTTCPLCRLSLIPKSFVDPSQQNPETVSSIGNSDGGGASAQPESQSVSEIASHIDDGQEGDNDCTEVSEEAQENGLNSTGTSDACCNCRLG
ncbi:RING-H2 finger protein ATL7 [Raphanus sativus]|uniref:RING-type E3 ubiquitin transferase n=1 Tax=Raphanus sativus TaxID=3726 RepID=A0A6J0MA05_RAPSA|nr:RING-H2 finger protein ATL7 [Raphanus sativus]KAJ4910073.1 RING-H2 finger protein ATL7 [Raphanus sativus]